MTPVTHLPLMLALRGYEDHGVKRMSVMLDQEQLDILRAAAYLRDKRAGRLLTECVNDLISDLASEPDVQRLVRLHKAERAGFEVVR